MLKHSLVYVLLLASVSSAHADYNLTSQVNAVAFAGDGDAESAQDVQEALSKLNKLNLKFQLSASQKTESWIAGSTLTR